MVVLAHAHENHRLSIKLIVVVATVIVLVIGAAAIAGSLIVRTLRRPIERAIAAADRVAAGDLEARIGAVGPEEFVRFGRAFEGWPTGSRRRTAISGAS